MANYSRHWVEHPEAVAVLVTQAGGEYLPIGGRFICNEEAEEEQLWTLLETKGLSLRGFGQCEVVAMCVIQVSNTALSEVVAEMRQIANESGYRLQSVEAGEVESGAARVLAGESGYVPWWEMKAET